MDQINQTIAGNLQSIRKQRQMTLQDLADVSGVSKSMLGEIERGATNPTITVLWKIITGLKIPISQLVHEQSPSYRLVRAEDWKSLRREEPFDMSLIFEYDHTRDFEVYHVEFDPGSVHQSKSHQKGVVEYTMVYAGQLTIQVDGGDFVLAAGDSFVFDADRPHSYQNDGQVPAKAYSLIHYRGADAPKPQL